MVGAAYSNFDGLSLVNPHEEDLGTFDAIEVESMEHSVRVTPVRRQGV